MMALMDIENLNHYYPNEYPQQDLGRIKSLQRGDHALILLESQERLWIRITRVASDGLLEGLVDAAIVMTPGVKIGDRFAFRTKHVIDVLLDGEAHRESVAA
jgi:hypothetical protein